MFNMAYVRKARPTYPGHCKKLSRSILNRFNFAASGIRAFGYTFYRKGLKMQSSNGDFSNISLTYADFLIAFDAEYFFLSDHANNSA